MLLYTTKINLYQIRTYHLVLDYNMPKKSKHRILFSKRNYKRRRNNVKLVECYNRGRKSEKSKIKCNDKNLLPKLKKKTRRLKTVIRTVRSKNKYAKVVFSGQLDISGLVGVTIRTSSLFQG